MQVGQPHPYATNSFTHTPLHSLVLITPNKTVCVTILSVQLFALAYMYYQIYPILKSSYEVTAMSMLIASKSSILAKGMFSALVMVSLQGLAPPLF